VYASNATTKSRKSSCRAPDEAAAGTAGAVEEDDEDEEEDDAIGLLFASCSFVLLPLSLLNQRALSVTLLFKFKCRVSGEHFFKKIIVDPRLQNRRQSSSHG